MFRFDQTCLLNLYFLLILLVYLQILNRLCVWRLLNYPWDSRWLQLVFREIDFINDFLVDGFLIIKSEVKKVPILPPAWIFRRDSFAWGARWIWVMYYRNEWGMQRTVFKKCSVVCRLHVKSHAVWGVWQARAVSGLVTGRAPSVSSVWCVWNSLQKLFVKWLEKMALKMAWKNVWWSEPSKADVNPQKSWRQGRNR